MLVPVNAASSSAWDRPFVADQRPTTGTSATTGGVGVGIGVGVVATVVRLGSCVEGARVEVVVFVGSGSNGGDGCVGAQDTRMTTIAAAPMDRRASRDPRTGPA